mmetsp:Transcript_46/g.93  ORF Transcript_46/g.93 Transcript_46/m.93 type:complete len:90 (+) Transcript_46:465-734(+)
MTSKWKIWQSVTPRLRRGQKKKSRKAYGPEAGTKLRSQPPLTMCGQTDEETYNVLVMWGISDSAEISSWIQLAQAPVAYATNTCAASMQ